MKTAAISLLILEVCIGIVFLALWLEPREKVGVDGSVNRGNWEYNNGIFTFYYRLPLLSGTTTPCAIPTLPATSTLIHASVDIRTSTTSANLVEIGKGTNSNSTSTVFATYTVAANSAATIVATSSLELNDNMIITPTIGTTSPNWLTVRFGRSYGSTTPAGNCQFILQVTS